MENWISVKDRLPETMKHVMIFGRYTRDCPKQVTIALFIPKRNRFSDDGMWSKDVTHWMPLPEPPEE